MATNRLFVPPAVMLDEERGRGKCPEEGIRVFRAALVGVVLSLPVWALCFWAVAHFLLS